ncbi:MAG: hypothetical protein CTY19_01250 [Methylomonas sp.]|nr:MAG: hypothetical protein CTY19_01250 [Methylomonas sp.]
MQKPHGELNLFVRNNLHLSGFYYYPGLFNTGAPFRLSLSKPDVPRPSTSSGRTVFKGRVNSLNSGNCPNRQLPV